MRTIRIIVAAVVATGMLSIVAPADAKVRDPISRKTQPEKGFFESKSTASARSQSRLSQPRAIVSQPKATTSQPKVLKARAWSPWFR